MTRVLGIDPGLTGAVALYCPTEKLTRWHVIDLPTMGEGSQRRINASVLRDWLERFRDKPIDAAWIESVHAWSEQGVASSFRFGRAVGAIEAIVASCNIPLHFVTPQVWKKFHGLRGSNKEDSRARAIQRFPTGRQFLERKLDHGRAEAMLIAHFGAAATGAISSMSPLDLLATSR